MNASLNDQKSPDSNYRVRYAKSFPIGLPAEQIDLVAAFLNGLGGLFLKKHLKKEGKTLQKILKRSSVQWLLIHFPSARQVQS